jgi:hypothetical protein
MNVTGIVWMGVRTPAFPQLRHLFGSVMGMPTTHETEGVAWFELGNGAEIQIYDADDVDHTFFGNGPVVGFMVDDFAGAVEELVAADVELVGDGDANTELRWQHFRGPDGNIYEILGPRRDDA